MMCQVNGSHAAPPDRPVDDVRAYGGSNLKHCVRIKHPACFDGGEFDNLSPKEFVGIRITSKQRLDLGNETLIAAASLAQERVSIIRIKFRGTVKQRFYLPCVSHLVHAVTTLGQNATRVPQMIQIFPGVGPSPKLTARQRT